MVPLTPDPSRGRELARRILKREQGDGGGPDDIVGAGEKAFRRLRAHLILWFGAEGIDALLSRAIDRAQPDRGLFSDPERVVQNGPAVEMLVQHMRSRPPAEAAEATIDALAAFIALLGHLVGDDMAERLIEQSWGEPGSKQQRPES